MRGNGSASTVTVTVPPVIRVCHEGVETTVERADVREHLTHGDAVGACAPA